MPTPPKVDEVTELSFIVNYMLQGCEPPFWLFVELSKAPLKDLALLIFGLDGLDITQAIFGPKGGRNRDSGRHGRKSRRFRGFPDPNDMVGGAIRTHTNPYDALRFGPTKFAFRIWNVVEGFNFAAALVEGLTDVGFETLWGVITADPDNCPSLPYLTRSSPDGIDMVGVAPWTTPFNLTTLENINLFSSPTGHSWVTSRSDYTVGASGYVYPISADGVIDFALTIYSPTHGILAESSMITRERGDGVRLQVEAEVPAGVATALCRRNAFGSVRLYDAQVFAFGGTFF